MQQRKGLTPIIAVVLLLMMTVAAAGLAYQFVIGTQSDIQDKVKNQLDTQLGSADIKWNVELGADTAPGDERGNVQFTIRNTGKSAIAANSLTLYVNGAKIDQTGPDSAIAPADTGTVSPGTSMPWPLVGDDSTIRMVHTSGISITYTCANEGGTAQDYC